MKPYRLVIFAVLSPFAIGACAANMEGLRPTARWLATERLKGILFHDTIIKPAEPLQLVPENPRAPVTPTAVVLQGRHYLVILPESGESIRFRLHTVEVRPPFSNTLYAVFSPDGIEIGNGLVGAGEEKEVTLKSRSPGPHVLLLNSGPASSTVTRVTMLSRHWGIDVGDKQLYREGPMHYHFLRDLKLGGFNLAMLDLEYVPQEFLTDAGLAKWKAMIDGWAGAAQRYQLRTLFAVDLGGTPEEVKSWGDAPKGLYLESDEKLPLAPCPLQKVYWERILLRRGREVAKLAQTNPYIVGCGVDPEMYQCWKYGHYMLGGICFCNHCLGGFLEKNGMSPVVLTESITGKERHEWLVKQKLAKRYDAYLEAEMFGIASWCRDELHRVNPDLLLCVYVLDSGNWFCRGLARGLSQADLPVINFCETTYYGLGYDRPWLDRTLRKFADLGANVLQGSAVWDLYFPPTKPSYLAAHAYNLAVRAEGWWYWPGDQLYADWNVKYSYAGSPAYVEDYWNAVVTAHHEVDLTMRDLARSSLLDSFEPVRWQEQYREKEDRWADNSGVIRQNEPTCRVRLAAPGKLYFAVAQRAQTVAVTCLARGQTNGAEITLTDPAGGIVGRVFGELDLPETITAPASEGVWTLEVRAQSGRALHDVALAFKPTAMVCATKDNLLVSPTKQPGLVGYWPMDEGSGERISDKSQPNAYNGALRDGRWITGVHGSALAFDGRRGGVSVAGGDGLDNLTEFTFAAWVRLDALPENHKGATLINKGPEAPVQHAWWWIGYPPAYVLTLELGNEHHEWGVVANSKPLEWKLGQWYYVATVVKCNGKTSAVTHYRDGNKVGGANLQGVFHSGDYDLQLGSYGGAHWLNGALDEVKIWDRALTQEEIRQEQKRWSVPLSR